MSQQILLATHNPGKALELRRLLEPLGWQVVLPSEVPSLRDQEVVEDGTTLLANASKKAITFGQISQLLTLADDTGFEITALDGQPGVHAKRYAPTDDARNQKVMTELAKAAAAGNSDRSARFVTVLCLYDPATEQLMSFEGEVTGQITDQLSSVAAPEGLGYDVVFIPEGYQDTFAVLGPEVKAGVSHRHRALAKCISYLKATYA